MELGYVLAICLVMAIGGLTLFRWHLELEHLELRTTWAREDTEAIVVADRLIERYGDEALEMSELYPLTLIGSDRGLQTRVGIYLLIYSRSPQMYESERKVWIESKF
jgi:hypothetical protein